MVKRNVQECSVEGCFRVENSRGLCPSHYMAAWRDGSLQKISVDCRNKQCSVDDCARDARKRGMCNSHYTKMWRTQNPERAAVAIENSWRSRAARRRGGFGSHTVPEWQELLSSYADMCAYCLEPAESRDHVVPLSRGGSDDIDNLVPACLTCNKSKNDKPLLLWLLNRPRMDTK